ncbi:hypothetical protein TMEC50S_01952 [Thauera mechernichensis]
MANVEGQRTVKKLRFLTVRWTGLLGLSLTTCISSWFILRNSITPILFRLNPNNIVCVEFSKLCKDASAKNKISIGVFSKKRFTTCFYRVVNRIVLIYTPMLV